MDKKAINLLVKSDTELYNNPQNCCTAKGEEFKIIFSHVEMVVVFILGLGFFVCFF